MKWGFKAQSERMSLEYRKQLGLLPNQALPARTLAAHLKARLHTPKDYPGLSQEQLAILCGNTDGKFSALTFPVGGIPIIIYNPSHSPARQESDIMHELAHVACDHKPPPANVYPGLAVVMRRYDKEQEDEANYLGACLQIPRQGLMAEVKKGKSNAEIADHFGASVAMVVLRMNMTAVKRQLARRTAMFS